MSWPAHLPAAVLALQLGEAFDGHEILLVKVAHAAQFALDQVDFLRLGVRCAVNPEFLPRAGDALA